MKTAGIFLGIFLAAFSAASTAEAEPQLIKWQNEANAQTCGESFSKRLADFREAVVAQQRYMAEYNRAMPWWREHCRWLSELEIAIRKIDDAGAFVCDTRKGRPKELTSDFVLDHQGPADIAIFVEDPEVNRWCHPYDAAAAVSLNLGYAEPAPVEARVVIEAMCWRVQGAKCDKARAALADAEHN